MSDLAKIVETSAEDALGALASDLSSDFVDGMKSILESAPKAARDKVEGLIRDGFHFKKAAITAKNQADAREYADAAAAVQRRIKTVLLAEVVVAHDSTAALASDLFGKALDGLGTIAKGLVSTIAAGLAKGAVAGLTGEGGDGFDPSSIFPFA